MKLIDLSNKQINNWHIVKPSNKNGYWVCWCDCQKDFPDEKKEYHDVLGSNIRSGKSKSCGCLFKYINRGASEKQCERNERHKQERLNVIIINKQGCECKCIEYNTRTDIVVEFQDKYKIKIHTQWGNFINGSVKNPYAPSVYNVGCIGVKYPVSINKKQTKEYSTWKLMLQRCYDKKYKNKYPTYQDVTCCEEWLLFENFYEWLHSQENFDKWYNGERWELDKDIIVKRNKIYSPETCCLVPSNVNCLFTKRDLDRGKYPIGVTYDKKSMRYKSRISISNNHDNKSRSQGKYPTPEDAFYLGYKPAKEDYVKQVAQKEFNKNNITRKCYEAMISYQVEITD